MIVEGSHTLDANVDSVWHFITNPRNVGYCLPDVKSVEIIDDITLRAKMKFGVDYAKGTFDGTFKIEVVSIPSKLLVMGVAKGLGSTVNVSIEISLVGLGNKTNLSWKVDVLISGILKPVVTESSLKALADNTAKEMFDCISERIAPPQPASHSNATTT